MVDSALAANIEAELAKCLLTGSRGYGIATDKSDWDYAVAGPLYDQIVGLKDQLDDFKEAPYAMSVYFTLNGRTVNVFKLSQAQLDVWTLVTEGIRHLCINPHMARHFYDKNYRIRFFRFMEASLMDYNSNTVADSPEAIVAANIARAEASNG